MIEIIGVILSIVAGVVYAVIIWAFMDDMSDIATANERIANELSLLNNELNLLIKELYELKRMTKDERRKI